MRSHTRNLLPNPQRAQHYGTPPPEEPTAPPATSSPGPDAPGMPPPSPDEVTTPPPPTTVLPDSLPAHDSPVRVDGPDQPE